MKNQNLYRRFLYSLNGIKSAWNSEASFRSQLVMTVMVICTVAYLKATPTWWAIFILIIGATLAAELFNTSLEYLSDLIHPEFHPLIGKVKDCAAASVLVLSLASIFIFIAYLLDKFSYVRS